MIKQLLAELKASVRLRIGLALIVAVLWVNGLLSLRDQIDDAAKRYAQLSAQINRMHQYATQTDWPERAKQAQMTQIELEGRLWRSGTPGLAQAAFQDWLAQSLAKVGFAHLEVVMVEGETGQSASARELWKIKAKLSFDYSTRSFSPWMAILASADRQVVVEKLSVHMLPSPRVEAILAAPFQKNAP